MPGEGGHRAGQRYDPSLSCPVCILCSTLVSPRHKQEGPRLPFKALRGPKTALVPIECPLGTSGLTQFIPTPSPTIPSAVAPRCPAPAAWSPRHPRSACARTRPLRDTRGARSLPHFPDSRVPGSSPPRTWVCPITGCPMGDPAADPQTKHPPPCWSSRSLSWTPAKRLTRLVFPTPGSPSSTTRYRGFLRLGEPEEPGEQLPRGALLGSEAVWPSWG